MTFDPTKPVSSSVNLASEIRNNFIGLRDDGIAVGNIRRWILKETQDVTGLTSATFLNLTDFNPQYMFVFDRVLPNTDGSYLSYLLSLNNFTNYLFGGYSWVISGHWTNANNIVEGGNLANYPHLTSLSVANDFNPSIGLNGYIRFFSINNNSYHVKAISRLFWSLNGSPQYTCTVDGASSYHNGLVVVNSVRFFYSGGFSSGYIHKYLLNRGD